ncbi:MAG: lipocalin family protein [Bacteroidales bacterium]|jgi:apolipoprotein D and lipocalin family protein|nr:lipocalin family protein [Bacteroidales bacterium]MDD2263728.1 lipocalin family protein [Bacteroidales bacterium]MDD2831054.1 lipocalin family protein [Bacteroidales bacterium]MDD3208138.1 lipocalin family protein [Bacteroidales bacterium]MDD3696820.1 lipocalin family protein [Bacteroidales bacterium]
MNSFSCKLLLLLACILTLFLSGCGEERPVITKRDTVTELDIERFMGTWHEVAQMGRPARKMIAAVHLDASLDKNGMIHFFVKTHKYTPYGPMKERKGKAHQNANFPGVLRGTLFLNSYRHYFVLYLDQDYTCTVICDHTADNLWIFSKEPSLSEKQIKPLQERIVALGFDPQKISWSGSYF